MSDSANKKPTIENNNTNIINPKVNTPSGNNNRNLHKAMTNKNDEYYTRIEDIESELFHYREHFNNKIVYCNCDDPNWSNFYAYFKLNFNELSLKKLIATHIAQEPDSGINTSQTNNINSQKNKGVKSTTKEKKRNDSSVKNNRDTSDDTIAAGAAYLTELTRNGCELVETRTRLSGNGDFRCDECISILRESDIIVTNPPFSLFREFVDTIFSHNKKVLVVGNMNAITYKEVFPLIKDNKLWLGNNYVSHFIKPDGELRRFGNILWYTNLTHQRRNDKILLTKRYKPHIHQEYDTYHAINVDKVADIPFNYNGLIGVPITFLNKHNPNQFEIVGCCYSFGAPLEYHKEGQKYGAFIDGVEKYKRLFIKNKTISKED